MWAGGDGKNTAPALKPTNARRFFGFEYNVWLAAKITTNNDKHTDRPTANSEPDVIRQTMMSMSSCNQNPIIGD
jgi:hypothetical protein